MGNDRLEITEKTSIPKEGDTVDIPGNVYGNGKFIGYKDFGVVKGFVTLDEELNAEDATVYVEVESSAPEKTEPEKII